MSTPFEQSAGAPSRAYPLERGWVKWRLIRDLATGTKTQTELADEFGVTASAISTFKSRHKTSIAEQAADLENEFAALWIAQKGARLAELQSDVEDLSEAADSNNEGYTDLLKVKHAALNQAAKELGQIPSTAGVSVQTQQAVFRIEGVDLGTLT